MGALAALLVIASMLLISNTIRLSLFSRRREVEVMKLVGATDSFIRWPFVIEGVVLGALGGVLAVLLLAVGKVALVDPLERDFALIAAPETIDFAVLVVLLLLAASVGVSAAGLGPLAAALPAGLERRAHYPARAARSRRADSRCCPARRCCCPSSCVAGIWLGGHPRQPARARCATRSSATTTRASSTRRSTRVQDDYYREIPTREARRRGASAAWSRSLDDRFSALLHPGRVPPLPAGRRTASSPASGIDRRARTRAACAIVEVFDDSPAERAGIERGDVIVAVDGRVAARASPSRPRPR